MATSTRFPQRNPPVSSDSENPAPSASFKSLHNNYNPIPKRAKAALGDITNLAVNDASTTNHSHIFKPVHPNNKLRRSVTSSTNNQTTTAAAAAAARRQKPHPLPVAKKPSPMCTSDTHSRRASHRLAKRAAAVAAAAAADVSCRLDFATPTSKSNSALHPNRILNPVDAHLEALDRLKLPFGVMDIDVSDHTNPLAVAEFASEIYQNFTQRETRFLPDATYMSRQHDITIKMRAILIDWLVDVHQKFRLQPETLHLTVSIIDRFLETVVVMRRKLQLVGVTAMLIACKYEEIYAPEVADFVYISDKAYSKEEILTMEALILNKLKFEVTLPSTLTFMNRCLKASMSVGIDHPEHRCLTQYLVELALQDSSILSFRPSLRAAAACKLAARLFGLPLPWDLTMTFHCGGWSESDLNMCQKALGRLLDHEQDDSGTNKLTAIKRKFASQKYAAISTYPMSTDAIDVINMELCPPTHS